MKKKFIMFCLMILVSHGVRSETIDRIVAKVGSDIITNSDTTETLALKKNLLLLKYGSIEGARRARELEKNFLEEFILEIILKQKITEEKLDVSSVDLESRYQSLLQARNLSENAWVNELAKYNLSLRDYKDDLRFDLSRQKFIQKNIIPNIQIKDTELQSAYEKHKQEFKTYNKYHFIEVMLVKDEFKNETEYKAMADAIQQSLKKNDPRSSELIRKHSMGGFKMTGGDSGTLNAKDINPEIRTLLDRLKMGETSQVFYNPNGAAFIFKLLAKSDPLTLPFGEVASTLKMQLAQNAIDEELHRYLLAEKDKTFIEIIEKPKSTPSSK